MGIYIINSSGGAPKCLTLEPEKFIYSINWSPDGKWIAYLKWDKHSSNDIETSGYVVELLYAPDLDKSTYYFTGLYNLIDSDFYKYETASLSFTYLIARNLRFITEYTNDLENEKNRFVLGIIGAF